ncbi:MAG TPA: hypothetical protein VIK97_09900, partial [Casimicrobiaceae bacterium]
ARAATTDGPGSSGFSGDFTQCAGANDKQEIAIWLQQHRSRDHRGLEENRATSGIDVERIQNDAVEQLRLEAGGNKPR